ncbi:MAG TPA: GntR family transcriptional regulator [Solirubrobacteraceae bacterium]|nr:GntR family transcriptional regulator [Solirubrobacteraceae bacterium]HSD79444.1 GntR family transcriptional regulator [Solirubrobacteraceae bacterium]
MTATGLPHALTGSRPKGEQLREVLEELIAGLGTGALLPSERALAERYGLARMTVRKELDRLVAEGAAYRVQGRGTFVAERRIVQADALTSFTEDIVARGMVPGGRVVVHELIEADDLLAAALEQPPGARVVHVERVRTADGEPVALEWAYLPAADFPGLERARLEDRSLLALLRERYGVAATLAEQRVSAVALDAGQAELLGTPAGAPAFLFRRVTRRPSGRVIEVARSLYRGDRYEIQMSQRKGTT